MKIFFIVGTGRCGTQMLRNILHSWDNVRILPETHFIIPLFNRYGTSDITVEEFLYVVDGIHSQSGIKFINIILRHGNVEINDYKNRFKQFVEQQDIKGGIKDFTEAFFEFVYGPDVIIGDKTPHYGIHADIIKQLWPSAKIIHIFRDGVQVASSMTKHGGFIKLIKRNVAPKEIDEYMFGTEMAASESGSISIDDAIKYWEISILETFNALENLQENEDYCNVRYEDVIYQTKDTITQMASFLGLKLSGPEFQKAILIPRPFPERYEMSRNNPENYRRHFLTVKPTLEKLNYPYQFSYKRSHLEKLAEVYRGRFYYRKKIINTFKHSVKKVLGT